MNKKILIIILINIIFLTGCNNRNKEINNKLTKINGMLSYTIDGEKTDVKPTKEDGYIVNKIICDNGSDMMWDNDNWEVELTKVNSKDRCKIDFTKYISKEGYRVTITSNLNSALDSLSKATTENGTVIIYSKSKIESVTGCDGVIENNKFIVSNVNYNQTCNLKIELKTLAETIKEHYPNRGERLNFDEIYSESALHTAEDDFGTSYYFTGNPNNWVEFGNFPDIYYGYYNNATTTAYRTYYSLEECQNASSYNYKCKLAISKNQKMLWRIVRINGTGSIRLLFAGTGEKDAYIGVEQYYSSEDAQYDNPAYVGWKYDITKANGRGNNPSYVYKTEKLWYDKLSLDDKNYIDTDAIYCNDRSLMKDNTYNKNERFHFAAYERLSEKGNRNPTFKCTNKDDRFTDGFGLITADELVFAGGLTGGTPDKSNPNVYYYLNKNGESSTGGKSWWTMTPSHWNTNNGMPWMLVSYVSLGKDYILIEEEGIKDIYKYVVRPVISLKKEVQVTGGDGSGSNPYTVTLP